MTYIFSQESTFVKSSVLRELLSHAIDPNIISLATGLPNSALLPTQQLSECVRTVIKRDGARALQYSPMFMPLREWIAQYMTQRGVDCAPEQVIITNGCQHGLTTLSRLFVEPGEPTVIEKITFLGIKQITGGRGAQVRAIPTDYSTGADMDALEAAFAQEPRPRLAVLIPDFHNPLGVSITPEKRQRAAQLANQYRVPLIEDDPYSSLRFIGGQPAPIKAHDTDGYVFYLGSFSKMLAPAMRTGWIVAPTDVVADISRVRETIDLETSTLMQRSIQEFVGRGWLEPHLAELNEANHVRRDALLAALDSHLGDIATWTEPEGGLFVWATLPDHVNTWDMIHDAIDHQVLYIPGGAFAVVEGHDNTMRLNFSNVSVENIHEGIQRLAEVIKKRL